MQQLAQYDPYSIKEIQFNVNKVNKYTTFKSILATLIILLICIFLNFRNFSNIWIPRSQLEIYSYKTFNQEPLKNFPFCIIAKTLNQSIPSQINIYQGNSTNRTQLYTTPKASIYQSNQQIISLANGRSHICYDLENFRLDRSFYIYLNMSGFPQIYIKTLSYDQLLYQNSYKFYRLSPQEDYAALGYTTSKILYQLLTKKMKAQVYDSLLQNQDPEVYINIQQSYLIKQTFNNDNSMYGLQANSTGLFITSQILVNNYEMKIVNQFIIMRENIGTIISKFLVWFSILMLLFNFTITPIIEWNYKLAVAKSIYQNKILNKIQGSFTTFLKFLISPVIPKNLCEQQVLTPIFQKLQKDMNILNIIKKQQIMSKLMKQNQNMQTIAHQNFFRIEEEKTQFNYQNEENSLDYDHIQLLTSKQQQQFAHQKCLSPNLEHKNKLNIKFSVQNDDSIKNNKILDFIKSLDISQTSISLLTNKGKGYGTKWNTILTAVVFLGMLIYLILSGFLTISTNQTINTVLTPYSDVISYTIKPQDLIVRMNYFSAFDKFFVNMSIIDQDFNIIQNISLLSGISCNSYRDGLNQSQDNWYCLPKEIKLQNSEKNSSYSIQFYLTFYGGVTYTFSNMQIAFRTATLDQQKGQLKEDIQFFTKVYNSKTYFNHLVQVCTIKTQKQQISGMIFQYQQSVVVKGKQIPPSGMVLSLQPELILVQKINSTIWDMIQTSWGIVILCFTIFLSKIANYINTRQRKKITSIQQSQGRSDIVTILMTQHKLQKSAFKDQLQSIEYFYKSRLPYEDLKNL